MTKARVDIAASSLARLKNLAGDAHVDFNFLLLRFMQERFLARLVASPHAEHFVLKGGVLLLAYGAQGARPTKDIDFLGVNTAHDREHLEQRVREIASINLHDGVEFLADSVTSQAIAEDAAYEGVRIKLMAQVGTARNKLQIDVGFGDVVSPAPLQLDYPTLLEQGTISLRAYSKETMVAEKFEAIVKLAMVNSRMKDFYDIAFMASEFDFEFSSLALAVLGTFARRETPLENAAALLHSDLTQQASILRYWNAFGRRLGLKPSETFAKTFSSIRSFLGPVIEAAHSDAASKQKWDSRAATWR